MDPNEPAAVINPDTISFLRDLARGARQVRQRILHSRRAGHRALYTRTGSRAAKASAISSAMAIILPAIETDPKTFLFPRGIVMGRDLTQGAAGRSGEDHRIGGPFLVRIFGRRRRGMHPSMGETNPKYSGPKPPYDHLDVDAKYSWLKTPRYDGKPMEVGPLARMVVGYASGKKISRIRSMARSKLSTLRPPFCSPRWAASPRGLLKRSSWPSSSRKWVDQLDDNLAHGKTTIFNPIRWDPASWPKTASGKGWHEAPRGSLGHWVEIEDRAIKNYQAVVPTTWNAGPRDAQGQRGAYEASLLNTPVADPNRPLEILRTIHSFDPCIACAVHVIDAQGREYTIPRVA